MRRRWLLPALLLLCGVATASEKDLKEARSAFDSAAKGNDPGALERAASRLAQAEPPRGAVELADRLGHPERRAALAARAQLARTADPKVAKAIAARLPDLKEARARRLLADALATVAGDDAGQALVGALRDRDATVREAAALALSSRDRATAAVASTALHEHATRDPSLRARKAAASAREKLGLGVLPDFDSPQLANGLPTRFFDARVLFLIDASDGAREEAFRAPDDSAGRRPGPTGGPPGPTPGPGSPPPRPPAPGAQPPPPPAPAGRPPAGAPPAGPPVPAAPKPSELPARPVSAYGLAEAAVANGVLRLADSQTFDIVAWNVSTKAFSGRFVNATAKATGDASDWLRAPIDPSETRNVALALRTALEAPGPPEEIFLFLAGAPEGRGAEPADAALAQAASAWNRGIPINVVLYELEPATQPRDEREKLDRERALKDRRDFVESLALTTGGRVTTIALERAGEQKPGAREARPQPGARGTAGKPTLKLVSGRVPASELAAATRRLEEASKGPGGAASARELVSDLAACPDELAAELALKPLLQGPVELQLAAIEGFSKNPSARVLQWLAQELRAQNDPARAIALARALSGVPGLEATRALAVEAERREGSGDLPRLLLSALSRRPQADLAAITSELTRAIRHPRVGLAAAYGRLALATSQRASFGLPGAPADRLLPERFLAADVAFLVDAEAAMDRPFATPPREAPPVPKKGEEKKPAAAPLPSPAPAPVSRREVALREVRRALDALAEAKASANVISLADGSSWKPRATPLAGKSLQEAREFAASLGGGGRAVFRPIERALEDPDIEEIWVIAAGMPVHSDDGDAASVRARVRALTLRRAVVVNVVLALGETGGADPALAAASRKDELAALTQLWEPIARDSGGSLLVRERCRLPQEPPRGAPRGSGVAPVASHTPAGGGR
ncbi:hypothetical protein HY251_16630 [bacterium]|nr:hypothetical protein [bacterium]